MGSSDTPTRTPYCTRLPTPCSAQPAWAISASSSPPSDPQWKDAPSEQFLAQARELVEGYGYHVVNVDAVVVIERPKILPHRARIRENIARILGLAIDRIGIKAKTSEGVGPVGRGESVEVHATAMISRAAARKPM